jgi:ribosomal protein L11 methyltransferase
MNDAKQPPWWRFTLSHPSAEEESYLLFTELSAQGTELLTDASLYAFFQVEESEVEELRSRCGELGFEIQEVKQIAQRDWIQECAEIWEPVAAGDWTVEPYLIESAEEGSVPPDDVIRIRPGMGFGTGHHPTTRTTLEFLQRKEFHPGAVERILDLGTGSGILAVGAAKLFSVPITAIDIDTAALDNASHNAGLNGVQGQITFLCGSIEQAKGCYQIIIANIYAEVLVDLADAIVDSLSDDGTLYLSGIREDKREMVLPVYTAKELLLEESTLAEGWHSLVLRRPKK